MRTQQCQHSNLENYKSHQFSGKSTKQNLEFLELKYLFSDAPLNAMVCFSELLKKPKLCFDNSRKQTLKILSPEKIWTMIGRLENRFLKLLGPGKTRTTICQLELSDFQTYRPRKSKNHTISRPEIQNSHLKSRL